MNNQTLKIEDQLVKGPARGTLNLFTIYNGVAALVRSQLNGFKPFEKTIERTTEKMHPSPKTITAAAMTTNRITSLRELLHYRLRQPTANDFNP